MTLLAACPGGNILEPAVAEVADTNLVPFADELVSGLTGPQNDVFHHDARFKMLAAGRRFGKTHLSLVQLIVWAAAKSGSLELVLGPHIQSSQEHCLASTQGDGPEGTIRRQERGRPIH